MTQRLARQRSTRRGDGVNRIGLAFAAADLPVRAVHLDHPDAGPSQVPAQAGAVGPSALNTDKAYLTVPAQPRQQLSTAGRRRVEGLDTEHTADLIDHRDHVHIRVRVDARGQRTCRLYDGHRHPFLSQRVQGLARTCREGAGTRDCWRRPGTSSPPDR
jgi:hypothetical protein